jgi:hypothetical protein
MSQGPLRLPGTVDGMTLIHDNLHPHKNCWSGKAIAVILMVSRVAAPTSTGRRNSSYFSPDTKTTVLISCSSILIFLAQFPYAIIKTSHGCCSHGQPGERAVDEAPGRMDDCKLRKY